MDSSELSRFSSSRQGRRQRRRVCLDHGPGRRLHHRRRAGDERRHRHTVQFHGVLPRRRAGLQYGDVLKAWIPNFGEPESRAAAVRTPRPRLLRGPTPPKICLAASAPPRRAPLRHRTFAPRRWLYEKCTIAFFLASATRGQMPGIRGQTADVRCRGGPICRLASVV